MSQENIKITNNIYERFDRGNYAGAREFFDADLEWVAADHSPLADRSPYRGLEKVRAKEFSNASPPVLNILESGRFQQYVDTFQIAESARQTAN